jgi:hypothetical protein
MEQESPHKDKLGNLLLTFVLEVLLGQQRLDLPL